jgi:septation ring formation regulator EzrA
MGFSLESFFEQLFDVLDREQKAGKTVKQLREKIENQYKYAEQCGYINKGT